MATSGGNTGRNTGKRTAAGRKSRGLWAAAALAVVALGVVGFFVVRASLTGGPVRAQGEDIAAPDITSLGAPQASGAEGVPLGSGATDIQLEDPADTARLKGEAHWAELNPEKNHRYGVKEPEAWLYLKNGWMLYVRADSGNFYIPDDKKQPERGMLQGKVRCEGYAPRPDGKSLTRGTLVRGTDKPGVVAEMESMAFDSTLGSLSTDDRVVVQSEEVDFAGTGLKLFVNQVKEQLNMLDVAKGEYLKFRPKEKVKGTATVAAAGSERGSPGAARPKPEAGARGENAGTPKGGNAGAAPAAASPVVSMYLTQFKQGVVVKKGEQTVTADELDLWARLIDNALPEGAIADVPVAIAGPERRLPGRDAGLIQTVAFRQEPQAEPGAATAKTPEEVTLTWTGPLQVRPLDTAPPELKDDHVFLRFSGKQAGLMHLADPGRQMTGQCAMLEYGATTRRLAMEGPGPSSVVLAMGEYEAEAVRIEADLGLGLGRIPGPGVARDTKSGERASWADQADFVFAMVKDAATGKERIEGLKTGMMRGKAALADAERTAAAEFVRAEFVPGDDGESRLDHVYFEEKVAADGGKSGSLTCDKMDLAFAEGEDSRHPVPTALTASGNVVAKDGPSTLHAGSLYARLKPDDHGAIQVTWAEVKGGAHFEQDDKVRPIVKADAAELTADPVKRIVNLIAKEGETATVVRGGAVITGPSIELDGLANSAWVVGPWTFVNGPDKRSPDGPTVTASGTKEMKFDDTAGVLDAAGDVKAEVAADTMSLDRIKAERVHLELTPGRGPSEGDAIASDEKAGGDVGMSIDPTGGRRQLIRARAEGAVREVEGGANAAVESWRFVADKAAAGGRRPERVLFLEGPLIVASGAEGTLDVDGDGRLMVVDRRYFEAAGGEAASGGGAKTDNSGIGSRMSEGSVGGSLFTWMGSMHLDRAAGTVHFLKRVRLNHKPQRDASLMELECEDLTAKVKQQATDGGADAKTVDGELESADVRGAVWGRSTSRELIADRVYYDAKTGKAEASASEGNRVTMYDRTRATTVTAARIMWDMAGDKIDVVDPGPVTAPSDGAYAQDAGGPRQYERVRISNLKSQI